MYLKMSIKILLSALLKSNSLQYIYIYIDLWQEKNIKSILTCLFSKHSLTWLVTLGYIKI